MHSIDILIIAFYIILTVAVGIWVSKRASKGLDSYFLGGKSIKWYYLGLSNGSGMFDVSGTAWMVGILFLYGVKSFMFMWLWPIWNQIFIMMFLAVWIRRSNIMTGSEWILTRFGDKRAGRASHLIVAAFAIIAAIGFIAYFFEGVGKFMTIISALGFDTSNGSICSLKLRAVLCINHHTFNNYLYSQRRYVFSGSNRSTSIRHHGSLQVYWLLDTVSLPSVMLKLIP